MADAGLRRARPVVLLDCDIVGRVVARPAEIQVGIMTAAHRRAGLRVAGAANPDGTAVTAALRRSGRHAGRAGRVYRGSLAGRCVSTPARSAVVRRCLPRLIVVVGCWSISVGDFPIPISEVIATLLGGGSDDAEFIVETLRLPRVLIGIIVGAAFGCPARSSSRSPRTRSAHRTSSGSTPVRRSARSS